MKKEVIGDCTLYNGLMEDTIGLIDHVDHILTDPPYLYIKHKFDVPWNEQLFFENAKRILPDKGFIALFGRGTSFYRWNPMLADLGFKFKEEIIWDKRRVSAPLLPISRVHETISLNTKKSGVIRRSLIPYIEQRKYDGEFVISEINKIKSILNNIRKKEKVIKYINDGKIEYKAKKRSKYCTTIKSDCVPCIPDEIRLIKNIEAGIKEKTIIKMNACHDNNTVHPTEKPVRLAERLLALISDEGDTIYDPFMGSGSFGVACINTGRKYIGSEMLPEYFKIACKRIKEAQKQPGLMHNA